MTEKEEKIETEQSEKENQQAGTKKKEDTGKEVGTLLPGDYTVHLFIETAKQVDVPEGSSIDMIGEVQIGAKKEVTKDISDVTATSLVSFNSHLFIELQNQSVQDLEQTKISLKLKEKGYFKDTPIGLMETDFSYIYNLSQHTLEHQWFALTNPESEDYSSVAAYLKISVSIYGANDSPVELKEDPNSNDENCIMPAALKPKFQQLKLHVIRGEHLPRLDAALVGQGSMEAYVCTRVGSKKIKTDVKKTVNDTAVWNQTLLIPVRMPIISDSLCLNVMDQDTVTDEMAGSIILSLKNLLARPTGDCFWANLYGAPGQEEVKLVNTTKDIADEMNQNPEIATAWKGRVLLVVEHEESENPQLGCVNIGGKTAKKDKKDQLDIIKIAEQNQKKVNYHLIYEFGTINNTPKEMGAYDLTVKFGEHEFTTPHDRRTVGFNFNRWNYRSPKVEVLETPYHEPEDLPMVFVYLKPAKKVLGSRLGLNLTGGGGQNKSNPIAYAKFPATNFLNTDPQLEWIELRPEPVEDKIRSPERAGVVSLRLSIMRESDGVDLAKEPNWKKRLASRPITQKLRCFLFQAKDLPAADEDGASDPKVVVFNSIDADGTNMDKMRKHVAETQVVEDTCDPMFYECLELSIDSTKGEPLPPFIFDVYDRDIKMFGSDNWDFLGRALINLDDCAFIKVNEQEDSADLRPPHPKWHDIRYSQQAPSCGQILVSFILTEHDDHVWKKPQQEIEMIGMTDDAIVKFDEYRVDINVLGLRSLVSPGLLPIKKAYIDFMLKSMVPPIAASALNKISTRPGPSGSDPTLNTVVSFNVPLPVDPLYAPSLACRVYDKIFKGFEGQLIGTFTIPIGQIMIDQDEEFRQNIYDLQQVITQLTDIRDGKAVVPFQPNQAQTESKKDLSTEDKSFRAQVRQEKQAVAKQLEKANKQRAKEEAQDEKDVSIAKTLAKIVPLKSNNNSAAKGESDKSDAASAATALEKKLQLGQKQNQLTKRLMLNVDEDSDDEGNTFTNPVAKAPAKEQYMPPKLDLAINASVTTRDMDTLMNTPRSMLSDSERNAVDAQITREVLAEMPQPATLSKKRDSTQPDVFQPMASPRVSAAQIEEAVRNSASGRSTPASAKSGGSNVMLNKFKSNLNAVIVNEVRKSEEKTTRTQNALISKVSAAFEAEQKKKSQKMILFPEYARDERLACHREANPPPKELFEPLGYDREPTQDKTKHYRRFVTSELEHTQQLMARPTEFKCYDLKRGQSRGNASGGLMNMFSKKSSTDESNQVSTEEVVGKFKALISICHRDSEHLRKRELNEKLAQIRSLLEEIYVARYAKQFPVPPGFFCELDDVEDQWQDFAKDQKYKRRNSDEIGGGVQKQTETFTNALTKSTANMDFEGKASSILLDDGRLQFRELMNTMNLQHLRILRLVTDVQSDEILKRLLISETKCCVRLYVIRAFNLASRDNDSPSDPYLRVILGDDVFDDRQNALEDEPNPDLYKVVDFRQTFPGCPPMKVQMWDKDLLFGDDLIGETIIDVEDRYFSPDFKSIMKKPIEYRKLYHSGTRVSQGTLLLWAEIIPVGTDPEIYPKYDISQKPEEEYQVRVVVWDTEDLKMMDDEGTTDGFIRCFFDKGQVKDTDTHFRNQDGKCSFNYRLLFDVKHPRDGYKLKVQGYDLDLFKSNDLIGESSLDLKPLFEDASLAKRPMSLTKDYYENYLEKECGMKGLTFTADKQSFWVDLNGVDEKGKIVYNGKVRLQIEVYPKHDAELNQVGDARKEPNVNPYLPLPLGRMELSLNPLKMLNQLVGPEFRRKMYSYLCIALCLAICIAMLPMVMSNLVTNGILAIFGLN